MEKPATPSKSMASFMTLLQMAPFLIQLVHQAETSIPGPAKGKDKLQLVLNTVNAAVNATPQIADAVKAHDLAAGITSIVNATVQTLNAASGAVPESH